MINTINSVLSAKESVPYVHGKKILLQNFIPFARCYICEEDNILIDSIHMIDALIFSKQLERNDLEMQQNQKTTVSYIITKK